MNRGATSHYDYVCNEVAKGVSKANDVSDIPVIFGVLTTESIEQAVERVELKRVIKSLKSKCY